MTVWIDSTNPSKAWSKAQLPLSFQIDRGVWMLPRPSSSWNFVARAQLAVGMSVSLHDVNSGWVDETNPAGGWTKKGVVS